MASEFSGGWLGVKHFYRNSDSRLDNNGNEYPATAS